MEKEEKPWLDGAIQAKDPSKPLLNFSPGPAPLPSVVLKRIRDELMNYEKTGTSVMCYSHRSPNFGKIFEESKNALRKLMMLPPNFEILFTHGGGHGQFAAVPLNLSKASDFAEYVDTGTWSKRAADEARKYISVNIVAKSGGKVSSKASYRYICSNETVNGVEFREMPKFDDDVPLVVDMSSDIASKVIDWTRVGVAFACAPKNIGHAGLTVVLVRRDLLDRTAQKICPGVLNWRTLYDSGGMYNTPPTFNIYTTKLVAEYILGQGGLHDSEKAAIRKARAIYDAIDESDGFYETRVTRREERSRMNIPFRVRGGKEHTNTFLREAYNRNMVGFRTKTPFGIGTWLRISLYTGTSISEAETLASFMCEFSKEAHKGVQKPSSRDSKCE